MNMHIYWVSSVFADKRSYDRDRFIGLSGEKRNTFQAGSIVQGMEIL